MSLLLYDWIACAGLAVCLGCWGPASWKARLIVCMAIGLLGWAATFPLMIVGTDFGYDISLAEDYINGQTTYTVLAELVVAIVWTLLWCCVGSFGALLWRRVVSASH